MPLSCGLDGDEEAGEMDCGVDDGTGEEELLSSVVYVLGISPRMRPAVKTQPPTACLMSESPVSEPVMNTFLATSREDSDSAFALRVRPEIKDEDANWTASSLGMSRISLRKLHDRKSSVPRRPTT